MASRKKAHQYRSQSKSFGVFKDEYGTYYIFSTLEDAQAHREDGMGDPIFEMCAEFETFTGVKLKEGEAAEFHIQDVRVKIAQGASFEV